jgi:cyclin B
MTTCCKPPQLHLVSFFMLELCLVEYQMLKYRPSLLAAAAVYTAQRAISRCWQWTKVCEMHSRYTRDQLMYVCLLSLTSCIYKHLCH